MLLALLAKFDWVLGRAQLIIWANADVFIFHCR